MNKVKIAVALTLLGAGGGPTAEEAAVRYEYAGEWSRCGPAIIKFHDPVKIAVAPNGDVYVTERNYYRHRVYCFGATGSFLTLWGIRGSGQGEFEGPAGVAVAPDGTVYVVDSGNRRVQYSDPNGKLLGEWSSPEFDFDNVRDVAVSPDGDVYVLLGSYLTSHSVSIRYFDRAGSFRGYWPAGSGVGRIVRAYGLAVSLTGMVYVADPGTKRIQYFTAAGSQIGAWGGDGAADGKFYSVEDVAAGPGGKVFVLDRILSQIQYFTPTGSYLGKWGNRGGGPGQFSEPSAIAVAPNGWVYVVDRGNHRVQYFKPVLEPN